MEQLTRAELAEALDAARGLDVGAVASALEDNQVVGLTGAAESGKSKLLRRAVAGAERAEQLAVVSIDLRVIYSPRHLARHWLLAVARAAAGPQAFSQMAAFPDGDLWSSGTRRADHEVREILRDDHALAFEVTGGKRSKGGEDDIARALAATVRLAERRRVLVVVDHVEAPELSGSLDVRALLWQLRESTQRRPGIGVALACRPGAVALAADRDAAFFGDGTWLTIEPPRLDMWRKVPIADDRVDEVYDVTGGHVWATLLVVECLAREPRWTPSQALAELGGEHDLLAGRSLQHAGSLHRLGPRLMWAIANDIGPYQAIPDALSRDIATAAQRLELGGLAHHAKRGQWRLVNPIVAAALRDRSFGPPEAR